MAVPEDSPKIRGVNELLEDVLLIIVFLSLGFKKQLVKMTTKCVCVRRMRRQITDL